MIMRLVKAAALMWLAKKFKDKALGSDERTARRPATRRRAA